MSVSTSTRYASIPSTAAERTRASTPKDALAPRESWYRSVAGRCELTQCGLPLAPHEQVPQLDLPAARQLLEPELERSYRAALATHTRVAVRIALMLPRRGARSSP